MTQLQNACHNHSKTQKVTTTNLTTCKDTYNIAASYFVMTRQQTNKNKQTKTNKQKQTNKNKQ